jgi:hypothetical protein
MQRLDRSFGPDSRNRLQRAGEPTLEGALAALETFYFALNQRRLDAPEAVWSRDPLAQLNNPLGGITRGAAEITALYARLFTSPARVTVRL